MFEHACHVLFAAILLHSPFIKKDGHYHRRCNASNVLYSGSLLICMDKAMLSLLHHPFSSGKAVSERRLPGISSPDASNSRKLLGS